MLTPRSLAKATVLRITAGSPAWKPQAMFALETKLSTSASMPIVYAPKLSPRSELRSTAYLPIYEHLFYAYSMGTDIMGVEPSPAVTRGS